MKKFVVSAYILFLSEKIILIMLFANSIHIIVIFYRRKSV